MSNRPTTLNTGELAAAAAITEAGITYRSTVEEAATATMAHFYGRSTPLTADEAHRKRTLRRMVGFAREHEAWCIAACNRPLSDTDTARFEEIEAELVSAAASLDTAARGRLNLWLNHDPRGATVRLAYEDGWQIVAVADGPASQTAEPV